MQDKTRSSEQIEEPDERLQRGLIWGVLIVVILGIIGVNIWSSWHKNPTSTPDVHAEVPDFSLTDQHATPIAMSDLRGKIWVADFIFTRCVAACPLMTDKMAQLQQEFSAENVHFVSFSVDPEYDTPAVLSQYADRYGAAQTRWSFLTGEKDAIYQLAHGGFNLAVGQEKAEILHSSRFVLVDRQGQIRGYYDSNETEALEELRRALKALVQESKK
jgi:protein SCO1